jgi:hypothetical protein
MSVPAGQGSNFTEPWFPLRGFIPRKNPLAGEAGVRGFSKSGVGFLLLMKTMGAVLPHRLSSCSDCDKVGNLNPNFFHLNGLCKKKQLT